MRLMSFALCSCLVAVACSTVAPGDDDAGVTTDPSGSEGSSSGEGDGDADDDDGDAEGTATSATTTTPTTFTSTDGDPDVDDSDSDEGTKLDVAGVWDTMPLDECTTAVIGWDQVAAVYPDCMLGQGNEDTCITTPALGCRPPGPNGCECPEGDCLDSWAYCEGEQLWDEPIAVCGPYIVEDLCCSVGEFVGPCAE